MKKLISLLLCALMIMSLSLTAFAIPPENEGINPMSSYAVQHEHSGPAYDATCNGTMQTWRCICSSCGKHFTMSVKCPRGPHSPHHCEALPV